MPSFLAFISRPAMAQVTKKPVFGKPYTTIGSLFVSVGWTLYQVGGVLGYCLRDAPNVLAKLAVAPEVTTINEEVIIKEIKESSSIVESELKEMEGEEKTFFHLYTVRELRGIGIDFFQWPPDKRLKAKVNDEKFAGDVVRISFVRGIDFGFNFPEEFAVYWKNTYKIVPDNKWQEMYKRGVVSSKTQLNLTLKEAIVANVELAIIWNESQSPRMLDNDDIRILQAIIEANKGEKS
jgi:hypothetical protein